GRRLGRRAVLLRLRTASRHVLELLAGAERVGGNGPVPGRHVRLSSRHLALHCVSHRRRQRVARDVTSSESTGGVSPRTARRVAFGLVRGAPVCSAGGELPRGTAARLSRRTLLLPATSGSWLATLGGRRHP